MFSGQALPPQLRECEPFGLLIDQSKQNKPLECGRVELGSFALLKVKQLKDFSQAKRRGQTSNHDGAFAALDCM